MHRRSKMILSHPGACEEGRVGRRNASPMDGTSQQKAVSAEREGGKEARRGKWTGTDGADRDG